MKFNSVLLSPVFKQACPLKKAFSEKRQEYKTQFKLDYGEIVDKLDRASYCT